MQGPRPVQQDEFPSLRILLNNALRSGGAGDMYDLFPTFLVPENRDNLLVYADGGQVVSHVGMTLRWASVGGCTAGVASIGAVATDPAYRGKGLATELMHTAMAQAHAWGADFMLISGGRGLYRRLGAADVGVDSSVSLDAGGAKALSGDIALAPYQENDLDACIALYERRQAYYRRPREEWETLMEARVCMCELFDAHVVRIKGTPCAYYVVSCDGELRNLRVMEFAGDGSAVAAGLGALVEAYQAKTVEMHVQAEDAALATLLRGAGAKSEPTPAMGTCLLLDAARLIERVRPYLEVRAGSGPAQDLSVVQDGAAYVFSCMGQSIACEDAMAAAELIFGNPERDRRTGVFTRLFPLPALWYGLSYV